MLDKWKTLRGIRASEIGDRLAVPFNDPAAYKEIKGGSAGAAGLTDIKTAWMVARLNEVFGPYGLGWCLEWDVQDVVIVGDPKRPTVAVKRAEFTYTLVDDEGNERCCSAPCTGGSSNELPFALKGMETSAIGNAVSKLRFQEPVYMGKLSHKNAEQILAGRNLNEPGTSTDGNSKSVKSAQSGGSNAKASDRMPGNLASHGDFVVPVGKYIGKRLAELDGRVLDWYAKEMKTTTKATKELRREVLLYQEELAAAA